MNVQLRNATKKYSKTVVLDDFSLEIESGEILAVVGVAGSGKSTLLRALSGSLSLSNGELLYSGESFDYDDPQSRRSVFLLPDAPPLVQDTTVLRNISTFLSRYHKAENKEALNDVVSMLRKLEVIDKLESPVEDLSSSEAFKVTIAILEGINPDLWILDEPFTSGLDTEAIDYLKAMAAKAADSGKTIIYSTSKVDLSANFATRICVVNKGQCYAIHSPDELEETAKEDFLISSLIVAE